MKKIRLILFFIVSYIGLMGQTIDPTDISFVSINPYTNEVTVSWYKSESPNIAFVRIHYIYDETTLIKAKTIADIPANDDDTLVFKTDTMSIFSHEAEDMPISFACDAYSTNGNNSTSLREYHTTMHCSYEISTCLTQLSLHWTPYYAFEQSITKYQIFEVTNGSTETLVTEVSGTTTEVVIPLNQNANRSFFIKAIFTDCRGNNKFSTSNMVQPQIPIYTPPSFITVNSVQVNDNNDVILNYTIDTATSYTAYELVYSYSPSGTKHSITNFTLQKSQIVAFQYKDSARFAGDSIPYYELLAKDNCGETLLTSVQHSPIRLEITEADELHHVTFWSDVTYWNDGVQIYELQRFINNGTSDVIYTTITGNNYIDDLQDSYMIDSKICYKVTATQNANTAYTSSSKKICVLKDYKFVVPNAINPFSSIEENKIFKPKYAFVSGKYSMKIYNRYGDCIFESNDINKGWDGTVKGSYVLEGSYQYKITVELSTGENINKVGSLTVIYK